MSHDNNKASNGKVSIVKGHLYEINQNMNNPHWFKCKDFFFKSTKKSVSYVST